MTNIEKYLKNNTRWEGECLIWVGARSGDGYGHSNLKAFVTIYNTTRVHRAVWAYYNGPIPKGLVVMHSCDNPICINILHLSIGTHRANMLDMVKKGRQGTKKAKGESHGRSKLTKDKVEFIRKTIGIFHATLVANVFEVSSKTIKSVRNNVTWKNNV